MLLRIFTFFLLFVSCSGSLFAQCEMDPSPDLALCHGDATATITFTGPAPGTTYSWTNDNVSIGLGASGVGDIPPFFALNGGAIEEVAMIVVTPTSAGVVCENDTFLITVNPMPDLEPIPDTTFCSGYTSEIVFSSSTPGAVFDWTNDNTDIGLGASGVGNISFIATNPGTDPISALISPASTAAGCENRNNHDFTITINPSPILEAIPDQVICANDMTTATSFTDQLVGTTYSWTNDTPGIGLAASGTGDVPAFSGVNATSDPIIATISVTPTGSNDCVGADSTFTITVNPTPLTTTIPDQVLCANEATTSVAFTSLTTGTTFTWTNDAPSIGLAASGSGDIASFTTVNATATPVVATITVTPTANGCVGPDSTFTITVNPIPLVNSVPDQTICANELTASVNYTSATFGTTFSWTNDMPSIGLAASGTGNIAAFTGLNATATPVVATITVTPTANGCVGPDSTFTITVNPIPLVNSVPDQTICANELTASVNYTSATAGTTFSWTNDIPSIGLTASGTGNIAAFTGLNATATPVVATITVTPTANGCVGPDSTFTITINPVPLTNVIADQILCANEVTGAVNFTSATVGTTFDWTNDAPSIGLGASGTGDIAVFTALNATATPVVATITVTPTGPNGCVGPDSTFTITVNPVPLTNSVPDQVICANTLTTAINYTSATPGATFTWTNDTPSIGLAASGSGDIAAFTALNGTATPVTATITVTPTANGCVGPDSTFTITVNPVPYADAIADQIICANTLTTAVNYTSTTPGTTFSWTNDAPSIGLAASGSGDIAAFTALNVTATPVTAIITVTPTANGCVGPDSTFTITVNPIPHSDAIADQVICANALTSAVAFTSPTPTTTFTWTNDVPSIGLAASGSGDIAAFTGLNTTADPVVATITVTPTANGCVGPDSTFTITVNPIPHSDAIADQVLCANTTTAAVTFTSATAGTTFDWTNDAPSIGLAASGTGNIAAFTGLNATATPVVATITVTPTANGCAGPDSTFTITVDPVPYTDAIADQVLCANTATAAVTFTSATAGTTFDWTNDTPSIGLGVSGSGDIASFTALNATAIPVVTTITVTPTGPNGCAGPDSTFTITVNPIPLTNSVPDQVVCANTATTTVAFASATAGTTFTWTNDTPSIGLAASGSGDITSFTALNSTATPVVATITVTPTANGCVGPDSTFTITVNPVPYVDALADQVICANTLTTAVTFTSATPTTTFTWTNDTPSIGLAAAGSGDIAAFMALNVTATPLTAIITVTPTANGCVGPDSTFTITVNPTPHADAIADQEVCANTLTTAVNYTSATPGATFTWTNDTPSIGLAASGSGDIAAFTALNGIATPVTATITVTPTANGCVGPDSTFTITVNPIPHADAIADQVLCANTLTSVVTFTSSTPTTTFTWTNDAPSIGLAASGSGDIAAFTALNSTATPVVATITVTPTANGCTGPDSTFTITVNPVPYTDAIADQVICANTLTTAVAFTSATPTTTFTWTNDMPSIGLAASGSGDIAAFTGLNATASPVVATITVTPMANGCVGPDSTFTITVNPIPHADAIADQVLCANTATAAVTFTSATAGTTFDWTNDTPSIGLAASGSGDIAAFTALNGAVTPVVATITVTPTADGCVGPDSTFTITVNPVPYTDAIADQVLCANTATAAVTFTSATAGTTFDWTNDAPSIGLGVSGSGDIASFTALNATATPVVATITVTPTGPNGCAGPDSTFTITVNPIPLTNSVPDQVVCANTATTTVAFASATAGTTFTWTNDTPSIGLAASGSGDITSFTALNSTAIPVVVTITVTPTANGCVGPDSTFTITVNPIPYVNTIADQVICANTLTTAVNYTSTTPGTTFDWTNDTPSIGLAAAGSGDIVAFTALNITATPVVATITVTPTADGCVGPDSTFTITVNPTPHADAIADQEVCANTLTTAVNYTSATPGATFTWTNDTPSIGLAASGSGNIVAFTGLNATATPVVATITVTPTANGCVGPDSTFTITVNPIPYVDAIADQVICANTLTTAVNYTSTTPGTTFDWTNDIPSIGLAASGSGDIAAFTGLNVTATPVVATITITPMANGCAGPDSTFSITVNPVPYTDAIADQVICANTLTTAVNYTSATPGTTFTWTNDMPSIGLAASGSGDIAAFTGLNTTADPVVATITVTPMANGCAGPDSTFTITINPIPLTSSVANQVICANTLTTTVNYTSTTPGTTFTWTNDTPSIGLAAVGSGDITSFTALNTTATPIVATITVTPTANGCVGPDSTFTITVNPVPYTDAIADQVLCANTTTAAVTFTSATAGTTFDWTNDTPSIGLAAVGSGNIASFTALNATAIPIVATITVTPTGPNGCAGPDSTFTITVNPIPLTNSVPDQVVCANTATTTVAFASATAGTTFTWTNDTPSIGLAASGSGDIASFTGLNATATPVVATITVTPTANGCVGPDSTFTITVNPVPYTDALADQVICANTLTTAVTFTSATPTTTFTWTNDTPSIGLAAAGSGDIAAFTALNITATPVVATITVTPTANGCVGPDSTFTITVNPVPYADALADQIICANTLTTAVTFTSATPTTTFTWTNDMPSIGLAAAGSGDIISFTGLNATAIPVTATITVTPTANGCVGPDSTFTITVNPIPHSDAIADQVVCANTLTTAVNYTSTTPGTTFTWTNDTPSIGLAAAGSGDIMSFTGLNTTADPVVATITVTPTANGCIGPDSTFTITIDPVPYTDAIANQVVCANALTTAVNYTSAMPGATFTWTNDMPSIGLAASGSGNIAAFTGLNATADPVVATITVTPTGPNSCVGPDSTFTITVNPTPLTNSVVDQVLCANTLTDPVNFTSPTSGATFDWVNDTPAIGLAAAGSGDIVAFTGLNTTADPVTATITVTPTANGCVGPDSTFTITVNPTPLTNSVVDQELCANTLTTAVNYTSATPGTTFDWLNDAPSIGLAASGTGNIPAFTGINITSIPVVATITVTPTANGCVGPDSTFTITVNPIPLTNTIADQSLCANTLTDPVNYTSATPGTTFSWMNDTPTIGLGDSGTGDIAPFTSLNATSDPVTATITVTPTANGCIGPDSTFTITVDPIPLVDAVLDQVLCANTITDPIFYTNETAGTVFSWVNSTPSIGLGPSGVGDIASFTALNVTADPVIASITVTPTGPNGCVGADSTMTITVNPIPIINPIEDQVLCANELTSAIPITSPTIGMTFDWTNDETSIGLGATGSSDIAPFTALNSGVSPVLATVNIIPTANGCIGPDETFTILVNNLPTIIARDDTLICAEDAIVLSGSGGLTYVWNNGVIDGVPYFPTETDTYVVIGTDINGCQNSDSVIIAVEPLPVISVTASDNEGCEPFSVTFENTSTSPSGLNNCLWDFGDGATATGCSSVTHLYQAGSFDLTLTTTSNTGCTNLLVYDDFIQVDPLPIASFEVPSLEITTLNTAVEFENTSILAETYEWDFGDHSGYDTDEHPIHVFPDDMPDQFTVTLTAYSPLGCVDKTSKVIRLTEELIYYIPNAFTPDGTGFNNLFKPEVFSGVDIYQFRFQIYNRWGELIFESYDPAGAWDGSYGGNIVPQGVYIWKLNFKSSNNDKRFEAIGHVTVLN